MVVQEGGIQLGSAAIRVLLVLRACFFWPRAGRRGDRRIQALNLNDSPAADSNALARCLTHLSVETAICQSLTRSR
jgi:hypothetical protein